MAAMALTCFAWPSVSAAQQPVPSITTEAAAPATDAAQKMVVLNGLDKITARISTIDIPIGDTARFGTLSITALTCYKAPPEEQPETAAFLDIEEVRPGFEKVRLFSGWMFASSPAVSALEHPVYDVWVTDCKAAAPDSESGAQ